MKLLIAMGIILAVLVATIAQSSAQTIDACVNNKTGALRIVTVSYPCTKSETRISWNQTGPPGQPGQQGAQGPQGETGPAGVNVAAGQQCADGAFVTGFDQQGNIICSGLFAIGDVGPAGGIVFYITDGGLHGLEAAPADLVGAWGCYGTEIAGADGTAVGTGAQNTADIVAGCSEPGIAARIVDDYTLNGYHDWFLPSKDELNLLYQQKYVVGGFADAGYWSSMEYDSIRAWSQNFPSGDQVYANKGYGCRVRAVRAF